jgi:membrane-associated phospholipid phosphatase
MRKLMLGLTVAACLLTPGADAFDYGTSGKAVAYAMPVFAGGVAIYKKDWKGLVELSVTTALTYGTAYGIKQIVKSCRPYRKPCVHGGTGWDSFPSTTAAIASAPSSFLWNRYGWEWGLPAFVISKYPSYALQKSRKNKLVDGLASTAISWGYNTLLVDRYHKHWDQYAERGFYSDLDGDTEGVYARAGYRF